MSDLPAASIADWLSDLGLPQYITLFADNDIDLEVLPTLTEGDLRGLGISFGHARKLSQAIGTPAKLRTNTPLPTPAAPASLARDPERRQLTVMFCDLVGSTELSTRLDPEELRGLMRRYQEECSDVIARYGGYIAQYLGDGLLVYFGYPQAHEDDAERACHTGLGIIRAMSRLKLRDGLSLQVRIGLATGLAVVGDLIGKAGSEQNAVTGQTPNLAARVQSLARPGSVVVSESTYRLLGGLFDYAPLGAQALKGFDAPVAVWEVLGEKRDASRFEATRASAAAFVGRNAELSRLRSAWASCAAGHGQALIVAADAGFGKSRLCRSLRESLDPEAFLLFRIQCSPHHLDSALYPVLVQLETAAGFQRQDSASRRLEKLEDWLRAGGESAESLPISAALLAPLLGIPTLDRYPPLGMTPQQQKVQTLATLVRQLHHRASARPVLYLLEDAHWIDPTTEELLTLLVESLPGRSLLVLVTARPEYQPAWERLPQAERLAIERLGRPEVEQIVSHITAGKTLPAEVWNQIIAKTDGIPLFVEELTRMVLESDLLREEATRYVLEGTLPPLAIPSTLQDSLMARLDRLHQAKDVAQIAATIGRAFSYPMISAVAGLPDTRLQSALARLCEAGLLVVRGEGNETEYTFKHALIQDAAYESQLRSKRQLLHEHIATTLEKTFPELVGNAPELLAHHYSQAGRAEQAIDYWLAAGKRMLTRSANAEAISHAAKGLALLPDIPDGDHRIRRELDLQLMFGQASMAVHGYSAEATTNAFTRAQDLVERVGDPQQQYAVLYGVYAGYLAAGRLDLARGPIERFFNLASQENDAAYLCLAHRMIGIHAFYSGNLIVAGEHLRQALTLYDPARHRDLAFRFGTDLGLSVRAFLAETELILGRPDQGRQIIKQALDEARTLRHAMTLAQVYSAVNFYHAIVQDESALRASSREALAFSAEHRLVYHEDIGRVYAIYAEAPGLDINRYLEDFRHAVDAIRASSPLGIPFYRALLARRMLALGLTAVAAQEAEIALEDIAQTGERWWEPELHIIRGQCFLALAHPNLPEAEQSFVRALATARQMSARTLELSAALHLAQLMQQQGKIREAHAALAPVLGHFAAEIDTPALSEARALLATLDERRRTLGLTTPASLAEWLLAHNLSDCAATFAANDIDIEIAATLTPSDLGELGFDDQQIERLSSALASLAKRSPTLGDAERRQVTVLQCELAEASRLADALDPESLHELLQNLQQTLAETLKHHGGFVAQQRSTGAQAYFGYPQAHENAAELALRAALAAQLALAELALPPETPALQLNCSVATGLVVLGDDASAEAAARATGPAQSLALALQSLARPGSVVVSESTYRLLGGLFDYAPLGAQALKGFDAPVAVWEVLGEKRDASRFEATRASAAAFVGRNAELSRLRSAWASCAAGHGQALIVAADAGFGKSRLCRSLRESLDPEAFLLFRIQCSPHHLDSALYPVLVQLETAAGFQRQDSASRRLEKLEDWLRAGGESAESLPISAALLAPLLGIPTLDRYPPLGMTPQQQKVQTLATLVRQLHHRASARPVLYLLEDAHWIDPTTEELLTLLVESLPGRSLLVLVTARPEYQPAWERLPQAERLAIERLGRPEVEQIVSHITAGKTLPAEVWNQIIAKTDGIPLFVEELTRMVLESDLLREEATRYVLEGTLPPLAIPSTLQDSLMARLDRLHQAKDVAQIAATIGRAFSYPMISAVAGLNDRALQQALARLLDAGLIVAEGQVPEAHYTFAHALIRDTAYESLLRSTRQTLHGRIADVLRERFADHAEQAPELLALHYTEAGQLEIALDWWLRAGRRAVTRSANLEAISHVSRGLAVLTQLPDRNTHIKTELDLQLTLGQASMTVNGYAADSTVAAFAEARRLVEAVGDPEQRYAVLYGLYASSLMAGETATTREIVDRFLELASTEDHTGYRCLAERMLGILCYYRGDFDAARRHLRQAIALYDPEQHRDFAYRFGSDIGLAAQVYLALNEWIAGYPETAMRLAGECLERARRFGHALTLIQTLSLVRALYYMDRDSTMVLSLSRESIAFCSEHHIAMFREANGFCALWAESQIGDTSACLPELRRMVDALPRSTPAGTGFFLTMFAEALLQAGQASEAAAATERARTALTGSGERMWDPETYRLQGDCLLAQPTPDMIGAESLYRRAVAEAEQHGAHMLALRAANSLARLLADTARQEEARALLAPLFGRFEEGFAMRDLREARAILESL